MSIRKLDTCRGGRCGGLSLVRHGGGGDDGTPAGPARIGSAARVESSEEPDDNTHVNIEGEARVNVPLGGAFSAQIDLQTEFYTDTHEYAQHGAHMAGLHGSLRDPEVGLVGLFGGGGLSSSDGLSGHGGAGWLVGGEGQVFLGPVTLYGQAGYADFNVDDKEGFVDGWFIRPVATFFPTDDSLIEAEFTHGQTSHFIDGNDDGVIWNWGLKGMLRVTRQYPIYLTASYNAGFYDSTSESDHGEVHAGIVGITFLFGAPSLKANNRSYAGLSTPMMPARTGAWVEGLD
jgi:hypothetical protein